MRSSTRSLLILLASLAACGGESTPAPETATEAAAPVGGQAAVQDDQSTPDVVKVAVGSPDHTTLVAALQAGDLVNSLANAGPFTVFAPTNAAFDKLPAGTVETLLKPENKAKLVDVLQNHVTTSALSVDDFTAGDTVAMAGGGKEVVKKEGGSMWIGGAKVIASVRASNGWVHVVDAVLVPAAPK
jgi:uncharacterized surface protein with fasciclin (FAS1) repeats